MNLSFAFNFIEYEGKSGLCHMHDQQDDFAPGCYDLDTNLNLTGNDDFAPGCYDLDTNLNLTSNDDFAPGCYDLDTNLNLTSNDD